MSTPLKVFTGTAGWELKRDAEFVLETLTIMGGLLVLLSHEQLNVHASDLSLPGTAKPTEHAKKIRIAQRTMRLSCAFQMACERGTLTQHMPAAKAPSRCEPMKPAT